jgi:hypothetical protein
VTQAINLSVLSAKGQRAVRAYGEAFCREAFQRHMARGEGASTIAAEVGMHTRQVDAAIDCGQELASLEAAAAQAAGFKVRYEGRIPQSLRDYCDAHAHQIVEVSVGSGYATESGRAYDVLLRAGWSAYDDTVHTVIEPTVAAVLTQLRGVSRCNCDDYCKPAFMPAGAK